MGGRGCVRHAWGGDWACVCRHLQGHSQQVLREEEERVHAGLRGRVDGWMSAALVTAGGGHGPAVLMMRRAVLLSQALNRARPMWVGGASLYGCIHCRARHTGCKRMC